MAQALQFFRNRLDIAKPQLNRNHVEKHPAGVRINLTSRNGGYDGGALLGER